MLNQFVVAAAMAAICVWAIPVRAQAVSFADIMKNLTKCNAENVRLQLTGLGSGMIPARAGDLSTANGQISSGQATLDPEGLRSPEGVPIIVVAAATDCVEGVHQLINAGSLLTDVDKQGNTPLHLAAASSTQAMVQMLVEKRAEINAKNDKGETPLTVAQTNNYKGKTEQRDKIIAYLQKKGAK
jgi:hypothetical protein